MRCAHDTSMLPLIGVPLLDTEREQLLLLGVIPETQAQRTTRVERMQRIGYQGPKERLRCESCMHCSPAIDGGYPLRCDLGNFPVLRGGLCREWRAG